MIIYTSLYKPPFVKKNMEIKINNNDLLWLCGFISQEADDRYRHTEANRNELKKILTKLRQAKK